MTVTYGSSGSIASLDLQMATTHASKAAERVTSVNVEFDVSLEGHPRLFAIRQAVCKVHVGKQTPEAAWDGASTSDLQNLYFTIIIDYEEVVSSLPSPLPPSSIRHDCQCSIVQGSQAPIILQLWP